MSMPVGRMKIIRGSVPDFETSGSPSLHQLNYFSTGEHLDQVCLGPNRTSALGTNGLNGRPDVPRATLCDDECASCHGFVSGV